MQEVIHLLKVILEEHLLQVVQQVVVVVVQEHQDKMHLDQQLQEMVEQDQQVILQEVVLPTLEVVVDLENLRV
tara:strand:- start:161 stop:379 length:219 start_codon:yes stop_codon:yes gene_type:complete